MSENHQDHATELAHAIHRSNEHHRQALEEILRELRISATLLAVGGTPVDREIENWPIPGLTRHTVSDRRQQGNDALTIPAQASPATLVMPANPGRLAASVINSGTNSCTLYLVDKERAGTGVFAIWLAAGGGAWDGRVSGQIWTGAVSAISANGTTLVWGQT